MRPRPPVRATRPSLVLETRLVRIPPSAVERLAGLAERQSEGAIDRSSATTTYFGATYFAFALADVRAEFAGRTVRELTVAGLARTLGDNPLLRLRLVRLAREEAERRIAAEGCGVGMESLAPGTARVRTEVTTTREAVVFEVAVEVPCVSSAPARDVAIAARRTAARGRGRRSR